MRDYEEAIAFYVDVLGFALLEDSPVPEQGKRWVVIASATRCKRFRFAAGTRRRGGAMGAHRHTQTGGRVFLFLHKDDFWRDFNLYTARGVTFVRPPAEEPHGTVAVFRDLYGNLWDLIQPPKPGVAPVRTSP